MKLSNNQRLILGGMLFLVFGMPLLMSQSSEYYFPQVADGRSGSIFYATFIHLGNPNNSGASVTIQFFRPNGTAWPMDLRSFDRGDAGGRVSSVTFTLAARESAELFTGGIDPLGVGWAKIESSQPIEASEVFGVFTPTGELSPVTSEAGVLPSPLDTKFSFFATVSSNEPTSGTNIDTGFAIINPGGAAAVVTATLFSRTGTQMSQKSIALGANRQTAVFASEVFNDVRFPARFHGLVRFSSNVNIAVVALRQTFGASNTISTVAVNPDFTLGSGIVYDREPNNGILTAQALGALPVQIVGTMNSSTDAADEDVFSVNLRAGTVLYVFAVADMIGSPLNDTLQIYNAAGTSLAYVDDFSNGLGDPFVRFVVPSNGTYYISHGSIGGTSSRDSYYRLLVRAK